MLKSGKLLSAHCTRTLFSIIQRVEFYAVMNKNQQFTSLDLSSSTEWKRNLEVRNSCLFNISHQSGATILGIHKSQIQSNLSISNSVNSKSPLFRRKIECPWIYPYPLRFPGYFEAPLFRTFFHFPWHFEIAGFDCSWEISNSLREWSVSRKQNKLAEGERLSKKLC